MDRYGVEQLSALLEAMAIEKKELTMLSFAIGPWAFASPEDLLPHPAYLRIGTMAGCFAHLKKLNFKLTYDVEFSTMVHLGHSPVSSGKRPGLKH